MQSKALHEALDKYNGRHCHYLFDAIELAASGLSKEDTDLCKAVNRNANVKKHDPLPCNSSLAQSTMSGAATRQAMPLQRTTRYWADLSFGA